MTYNKITRQELEKQIKVLWTRLFNKAVNKAHRSMLGLFKAMII